MRWVESSPDGKRASHLANEVGVSLVLADLLVARGLTSPEAARDFLDPSLGKLRNPLNLGSMPDAIKRVRKALKDDESILIFGDYDVDGITSIVFLKEFLKQFGAHPRYLVPHRLSEGYGMTIESLSRAMENGKPNLVIAVDCGTGNADEVAWLRKQGISVIILDHHTSKESLPDDCVLVNPHVHDEASDPWMNLCAVGLVFKFCHAFVKVLREEEDPIAKKLDLRDYLDLVALGTVADLVSLTDENRILVRSGLKRLESCRRPGICSLMEVAGLSLGKELTPGDIGFRLGPRINASGRLDDAELPIKLLLSENLQESKEISRQLDDCNRERQDIERAITEEAVALVKENFLDDSVLVVHQQSWHAGVVGIVASRLARTYHRPAIVLASDSDGAIRGSGRSVKGVDLVEVLKACEGDLVQWGGHPMAVGLTVQEGQLDHFRESMNGRMQELFPRGLPEPILHIDGITELDNLTPALLRELDLLAPFGQGNEEPVFAIKDAFLRSISPLGKSHFKFAVIRNNAADLDGVAWNFVHNKPPVDRPVNIAARFHWHSWRGNKSPRLTLLDWNLSPA